MQPPFLYRKTETTTVHVYSLDSVGVRSRCLDMMPGTVCPSAERHRCCFHLQASLKVWTLLSSLRRFDDCWHLYIYIVKCCRPCFVGGAIQIPSIDWLIFVWMPFPLPPMIHMVPVRVEPRLTGRKPITLTTATRLLLHITWSKIYQHIIWYGALSEILTYSDRVIVCCLQQWSYPTLCPATAGTGDISVHNQQPSSTPSVLYWPCVTDISGMSTCRLTAIGRWASHISCVYSSMVSFILIWSKVHYKFVHVASVPWQ